MPKREDIHKILLIGSGPIVIGQASEFDYSGTQAARVLEKLGYEVVLVNSNPATIMTDPTTASRTYIEPLNLSSIENIIKSEQPDALLPTVGGQTALNLAVELSDEGILDKYEVELIGVSVDSIKRGEDRHLFAQAMDEIGIACAKGLYAYSVDDAVKAAGEIDFPIILRPSFTLGGAGGGITYDLEELKVKTQQGIDLSPTGEVLLEQSLIGWKEFELEVVRDVAGNGIIVCSIENLDPMGVHTGDSITVAPAQTLTDSQYQQLRDASLRILEKIGVSTGGSNVQFALNPTNGDIIVIEMNPRVSRSSALASKATGFPIAKVAAQLAVGLTLPEITNEITGTTPACFEPSIDYCVVKVPRFTFEKFKGTTETLTTKMKSVGEVMAIGRTFIEALNKAMRSLEEGRSGLGIVQTQYKPIDEDKLSTPTPERIFAVADALRQGETVERIVELTQIDRWFINQIAKQVEFESSVLHLKSEWSRDNYLEAKTLGLSDEQICYLQNYSVKSIKSSNTKVDCFVADAPRNDITLLEVRHNRLSAGVKPVFKMVDTCAGEFDSSTNYYYKTYADTSDQVESDQPKVIILGSGPNRIGQGIEFDYCCVHASIALQELGYESIMVNCNPETVSTDYDTSSRLYFEPIVLEDVLDIIEAEKPIGVIVALGGQTPLKLARDLAKLGVPIWGTSADAIDLAEDRERFSALLNENNIAYPNSGVADTLQNAVQVANRIGYPVLVRPSYVLGGRGMYIAYSEKRLSKYLAEATAVTPDKPVYLDQFLDGAIEVDVDVLCDGKDVYIAGIMEHIEEAGIHSGDSSCCLPPHTLNAEIIRKIEQYSRILALKTGALGLCNIQYAVHEGGVYVIEVNPRASRTTPFVAKATGLPVVKLATYIMAGLTIAELKLPPEHDFYGKYCVKEAVLPFDRFPDQDTILGPEMKSTGEVMGAGSSFAVAYAKAQLSVNHRIPTSGNVFISVKDGDKTAAVAIAMSLHALGFVLFATAGTARAIKAAGLEVNVEQRIDTKSIGDTTEASISKSTQANTWSIADEIEAGNIDLIINTPYGSSTRAGGYRLRTLALRHNICYTTTIAAGRAIVEAIGELKRLQGGNETAKLDFAPRALQDEYQYAAPVSCEQTAGPA